MKNERVGDCLPAFLAFDPVFNGAVVDDYLAAIGYQIVCGELFDGAVVYYHGGDMDLGILLDDILQNQVAHHSGFLNSNQGNVVDPLLTANIADGDILGGEGYEHTLVITGEGMVNAIKYRNSRTELKEDFKNPFNFTSENKAPDGEDAKCVYIPFSAANSPYHKYNASTNTYKRWQYGDEHVDKDGDQLEFTNIIILFCHHTGPLDDKLRIEITTTGEGDGYYVSGGKYVPIKYSKANEDAQVVLMNEDGSPLEINRGKTYIAIYNSAAKANINMNYEA